MKTPGEESKEDTAVLNDGDHDLRPFESHTVGTTIEAPADVFNSEQGDVDFRGVSWPAAAILIAKFQIGLGTLSIPHTFHVLGFVPGILCFLIIAAVSTVAGYVCGNARRYYPHLHSIGDAAALLFGPGAREFVGGVYYIYLAMTAGAGMLTTSVALNALSDHGACTTVFVVVSSAVAFVIGTGFRSLERVAWLSWVGVAGIVIAIWVTTIACLAQDRPAAAPPGPVDLDIRILPHSTFAQAMAAISNQLFAVGASGTFFSVAAEMRHPDKFTRALLVGQSFMVLTCIAIDSIVYGKIGQYLASPALGSAGPLIKKISYGIALPGLVMTAVLYSHIAAKYWFVRILRGTSHLQSSTVKHWTIWVGSMAVTVIFGFIVVGVVPFFSDFLSLVGALVNPIFTNVLPGFMIMFYIARRPAEARDGVPLRPVSEQYANEQHWLIGAFKAYQKGWKNTMALALACFLILSGAFIIVGGTYGSVLSIQQSYHNGAVRGVFSCGDNS